MFTAFHKKTYRIHIIFINDDTTQGFYLGADLISVHHSSHIYQTQWKIHMNGPLIPISNGQAFGRNFGLGSRHVLARMDNSNEEPNMLFGAIFSDIFPREDNSCFATWSDCNRCDGLSQNVDQFSLFDRLNMR